MSTDRSVSRIAPARRRGRRIVLVLLSLAVVVGIVAVCGHTGMRTTAPPGPSHTPTAAPPASAGTPAFQQARSLLAAVPVKGWDRAQDFTRYRFGEPWSDDVDVETRAQQQAREHHPR